MTISRAYLHVPSAHLSSVYWIRSSLPGTGSTATTHVLPCISLRAFSGSIGMSVTLAPLAGSTWAKP